MRRKTVLIAVDQATRDALQHLLLAQYLRRRGVRALLCNQGTLIPMSERYRPDVAYVPWLAAPPLMQYLRSIRPVTRIVAMDQEGGRLRKEVVRRAFEQFNGAKRELAGICDRVFVWGAIQAQWLEELQVVSKDRIVVTGSARWDPYLVQPENVSTRQEKYIGVTLRADIVTASPRTFMEHVYEYRSPSPADGIALGYPVRAEYEDRIWHVVATTRYLFKLAEELARRTGKRVVFRPGPWEQYGLYRFLTGAIPGATVRPDMLQHDYVRGAFVVLDDASNLGLEALLAGTPVISVQAMVPRLEEHIGGEDAGLFDAPFTRYYWKPKTIDDALDYAAKAERGELPLTPDPEGLRDYLRNAYDWPRARPSSFVIGDTILGLLDIPADAGHYSAARPADLRRKMKNAVYRYMPGAVSMMRLKMLAHCALSPDRQCLLRYHYFRWVYLHHRAARALFAKLQGRDIAPQERR